MYNRPKGGSQMKQFYELIKANIIEFDRLLLEKYASLELNETETILLIKLHQLSKKNYVMPSVREISSLMYIKEEDISDLIYGLLEKGFLDLIQTEHQNKESYDFDGIYKRMSLLLENDQDRIRSIAHDHTVRKVAKLLEREWKKTLSTFELEIIVRWIEEKHHTYEEIEEAVLKGLKQNQTNIKYVDRILANLPDVQSKPSTEEGDAIRALFNEVYFGSKKDI